MNQHHLLNHSSFPVENPDEIEILTKNHTDNNTHFQTTPSSNSLLKNFPDFEIDLNEPNEKIIESKVRDICQLIFPELMNDLFQKNNKKQQDEILINQTTDGNEKNLLKVKPLTGGTTNKLFLVQFETIQKEEANGTGNTFKILVRVYGFNTEGLIDREKELLVVEQLSNFGQGAQIYAKFKNGYVYDYTEGYPLKYQQLSQHSRKIAAQLAQFHSLNIKLPTSTNSSPCLFKNIDKWSSLVKHTKAKPSAKLDVQFDLNEILSEIRLIEEKVKGSIVKFCHNDLAAQNIIYNEETETYRFIDTEYCDYNFRSFDIANHFCEWVGFGMNPDDYPTKEQQIEFLSVYLEVSNNGKSPSPTEIENLRLEVNKFALLSHLSWTIWALYQNKVSTIDFDYIDYAKGRMDWYWLTKEKMISNN